MTSNQSDIELIDKYMRKELSETERDEFEKRSEKESFREELNFRLELKPVLQKAGREDLKLEFKDLEEQIAKKSKSSSSKVFTLVKTISIAASLIGLLFVGNYLLNDKGSNEEIFAQFYEPYPNVVSPIMKSEQEISDTDRAFQSYQLKNYAEAEIQFSKLPKNSTNQFYHGLVFIELESLRNAEELLRNVSDDPEARFQIPAKWYLGLILIQTKEFDEAKEILKLVSTAKKYPILQKKAVQIMKKL